MARAWMLPEECWWWREDGDGAQAFQMARQVTSAGKASLAVGGLTPSRWLVSAANA